VDFSFRPPNADYLGLKATPAGIVEATKRAEALGFDAVFLNDHIIVKGPPAMVESWGNTFDPLTSLGYLAAVTERIRLGTSVLIVPYRNPIATAKMIATLDQLSGGRMIVAAGARINNVSALCRAHRSAIGCSSAIAVGVVKCS
jgi:alkanesulfonate monooxygenase SsuD/methylene tetrahydromethanopterin reductase-like flavin-dependent oxidoreductase (luciferase family)